MHFSVHFGVQPGHASTFFATDRENEIPPIKIIAQFSVDRDLDSDLDSVVDFVVRIDVVVGLQLGFLIVVFVKDRLLIGSSLLFLLRRKHRRDQTNLQRERDLKD